jgi:hypothetical protein
MLDVNVISALTVCLALCWWLVRPLVTSNRRGIGKFHPMSRKEVQSRLLMTAAVAIWTVFLCLMDHYDQTRPTVANEQSGQTHPLTNHGHVVYLTGMENFGQFFLPATAALCFISGYLIYRRLTNTFSETEAQNPET